MSQKCKFCFHLYLKEIYAQFEETNGLVKHNIYQELKQTIMDLDLLITRKHPVLYNNVVNMPVCVNKYVLLPNRNILSIFSVISKREYNNMNMFPSFTEQVRCVAVSAAVMSHSLLSH